MTTKACCTRCPPRESVVVAAPSRARLPTIAADENTDRCEAQHDGNDRAQGHGKRERSRVEPIFHARDARTGLNRRDRLQHLERNSGEHQPGHESGDAEHQVLDEQIPNEHTVAGTELRTAAPTMAHGANEDELATLAHPIARIAATIAASTTSLPRGVHVPSRSG
jgi:hypothetical protein